MFCIHCGKEIDDDLLYCPFCGKRVDDEDADEADAKAPESAKPRHAQPELMETAAAGAISEGAQTKKKSRLPLIIGAIVLAAGIGVGAFAILGTHGGEEAGEPESPVAEQSTEDIDSADVAEAKDQDVMATVFFASDYGENKGWDRPSTTLASLLKTAKGNGKNPEEIIMLGDYKSIPGKNNYDVDPDDSITEIQDTAQKEYPDLTPKDFIFVQGNTDKWSSSLSDSGLQEFDDYLVYVVNTQSAFPWSEGKNEDSLEIVEKASERMEQCFDELIAKGETRPVFIASHMPLHFTARTASKTGDNMYSSLFFDVINKAGNSLDIVYLYGHNCAKGWDCYLGGSSVYKPVGDTLLIPKFSKGDSNTDDYTVETLNFTYLNGGYVGYYMNCSQDDLEGGYLNEYSAADETLTGTVCEIYPKQIVLTRYDVNGVHPIGWDGEADPFDNYIDKDLIDSKYYSQKVDSPQVIDRR